MIPKPIKICITLIFTLLLGIFLTGGCASNAPAEISSGYGSTAAHSDDVLRVFLYNIQHGRGMDGEVNIRRIANVIQEKDPHLVALNEVDVNVDRSGNIDIMDMLSKYLDMDPVFYQNIPHQGGEYGNGILTKLPLVSSQNLHLDMPDGGEQRGLLQTTVYFNDIRIAFMTTHLDNRSSNNRQSGVEQIIEVKQNYSGLPVIMTGDFNAIPDDDIIKKMRAHFTDVWDERGSGPGYTIPVPASRADRRIDYIFYSNNLVGDNAPAAISLTKA
jgi:endonuclease/exonuclease/phosphatase family metal-dependent hydrolase